MTRPNGDLDPSAQGGVVSQAGDWIARWRSICPNGEEPRVKIDQVRHGWAHTAYQGRCEASITAADIERLFYHDQFGGRGAKVEDGRFEAIRHLD